MTFLDHGTAEPPVAPADQISPQHVKEQQQQRYSHLERNYPADNVDVAKTPILAGWVAAQYTLACVYQVGC